MMNDMGLHCLEFLRLLSSMLEAHIIFQMMVINQFKPGVDMRILGNKECLVATT